MPDTFLITELGDEILKLEGLDLKGRVYARFLTRVQTAMRIIIDSGHQMPTGEKVTYKRKVIPHPNYPEQRMIAQYTRIPYKTTAP